MCSEIQILHDNICVYALLFCLQLICIRIQIFYDRKKSNKTNKAICGTALEWMNEYVCASAGEWPKPKNNNNRATRAFFTLHDPLLFYVRLGAGIYEYMHGGMARIFRFSCFFLYRIYENSQNWICSFLQFEIVNLFLFFWKKNVEQNLYLYDTQNGEREFYACIQ